MIGRQKLDGIGIGQKPERMQSGRMPMDIDVYIPVFTILQFFFYMGLLKVRNGKLNSTEIEEILYLNIMMSCLIIRHDISCWVCHVFILKTTLCVIPLFTYLEASSSALHLK